MNIKKLLLLSFLLILTFNACEEKQTITQSVLEPSKDIKIELPTFKLTTTDEKTITIKVTEDGWIFEEYKNKVILLNFFATWCPPCKAEIPHLNHLQKEYGKDFQVISVLLERDKPNDFIQKFIDKFNVQYPITNSPENFNLSAGVGGVQAIPTMFLFTKEGKVFQKYKGAVSEEILTIDIQKAIYLPKPNDKTQKETNKEEVK